MEQGHIFWFTGLSGAGKSAIARGVQDRLHTQGMAVRIVDGDDVRGQRKKTLSFSREDIVHNNRAVAGLCAKLRTTTPIILVPIISPIRQVREETRARLSPRYYEIYIEASLGCVMERDAKGLYAKFRRGELADMIGCRGGVAYEPPLHADLVLNTEQSQLAQSVDKLANFIKHKARE